MSVQNPITSIVALWLLPILILSSVGPSGNNEANKSPDFEVPWSWKHYEKKDQNKRWDKESSEPRFPPRNPDTKILFKQLDDLERLDKGNSAENPGMFQNYIHSKSLPAGSEAHILKQDNYHDILGPLNLAVMNAADVGELEQIMNFQRANDWNGKPSEGLLVKFLRKKADRPPKTKASPTPTKSPFSTKTTAVISTSSFCLKDSSPFRTATSKCSAPPTRRTMATTRRPSSTLKPTTCKVQSGSKCGKKSKLLTAKMAKIILEIILATKQHVLSVLKTLNTLEMEVLSQSPEDCSLQDFKAGQSQPKKQLKEKFKKPMKPSSSAHSHAFFFGIRPASQMESVSDMVLAREEELKLKSRVWEEHKQQMRQMPHRKSSRFQMAPQAAVRLEDIQEPQGPQEPLKHKYPLKHPPNRETSDFEATWSPTG